MPVVKKVLQQESGGATKDLLTIYRIIEVVQVYNPHIAHVISHLLNHVHLLAILASGNFGNGSDYDDLAPHSRYETDSEGESFDVERVTQIVRDECIVLMDYLIRFGSFTNDWDPKRNDTDEFIRIRKALQDRVPFIGYNYEDYVDTEDHIHFLSNFPH